MIKFKEKLWLIHVPAAAVIHEQQALFAITKCKLYLELFYFLKKLFFFFKIFYILNEIK